MALRFELTLLKFFGVEPHDIVLEGVKVDSAGVGESLNY